uniref:Prestin n=1 Tax=Aceria tosichella TaxID=561515 RepID=A0A6G1SJJ8_9ACAR
MSATRRTTTSEPEHQLAHDVKPPEGPGAKGVRDEQKQKSGQGPEAAVAPPTRPGDDGLKDCDDILLRQVDDQVGVTHQSRKKRQRSASNSKKPLPTQADQHEVVTSTGPASCLDQAQGRPQQDAGRCSGDRDQQQEAHQLAFAVPVVSVATYDADGKCTNSSLPAAVGKQQGRAKLARINKEGAELPAAAHHNNDSNDGAPGEGSDDGGDGGAASTTSEVNSLDGAESIASRLSQIVDEQEFLMNHALANVSGGSGPVAAGFGSANNLAASSKFGEQEKRSVSLQHPAELSRPALDVITGRLNEPTAAAAARDARQLRNRTKSFAGQVLGGCDDGSDGGDVIRRTGRSSGEPAIGHGSSKLADRRNESSGAICLSTPFNPERGDLRSLKQQASTSAQNSGAATESRPSFGDQSNSGELMLNIRRSAWKLDEFEQAFKPPSFELDSPLSGGVGDFGMVSAISQQDPSGADLDRKSRHSFERHTLSSSSTRNFLARASRRFALNKQRSSGPSSPSQFDFTKPHLAQSNPKSPVNCVLLNNGGGGKRRFSHSDMSTGNWPQQQQAQLHHQNQQLQQANNHHPSSNFFQLSNSSGSSINTSANKINLLRVSSGLTMEELAQHRRSSGISMASFASSFDSSQTSRPFGRLGSLLTGSSARRHRHRHEHHRDDNNGADDSGGGCQCSRATLGQYLPVLEWLPAYSWRDDFLADLTAGLAVAALNISTSLSAAVVAETELGVAFRSSIFNTFVYAILCSSRHSSFGSWSIMSQMLLDSVRRALGDELILNRINLGPQASWNAEEYEMWHMNIIIMYTFLIGLVQLLAGLLNLGNILASFIPEALCSSMIAATAFTMAIGQLANMCGTSNKILWAIERNTTELAWADLKQQPVSITDLFAGLFRWIQQIALLVKHYEQINWIACLISLITVILLFINQSYLQAKLRVWFRKDNLFIPFEMLLLIVWICVGYALELRDKYHVATCGPIFIEFNLPNVPNLRLVRELWLDSLATALISYTMVFIMAKTYSNKFNYEINGNQELIACGAGNLIGGLFDALPATASFSRTAGQVEAGGRTQMASLVNCVTLVVLAQYLGHHVAHLPVCVMSATLFFGFVRMMTRTREALVYWRLCKVDFAIWFFTFGAIITFDLVNGFLYGFIFSLITMLYRAQNRRCYMLGSIGSSDVYVPLPKYPLAHELDGIKIFQFCGPIHYVCADLFERLLRQKTRVNVKELLKQIEDQQQEQQKLGQQNNTDKFIENGDNSNKSHSKGPTNAQQSPTQQATSFNPRDYNLPSHIILDFSMISNLDTAGIRIIKKIIVDYQRVNITIMLASLASHVAQVVKSDPELWEAHKDRFYLTLADAVHHALHDTSRASGKMN